MRRSVVLAVVAALLIPTAAVAHWVYNKGLTYDTGSGPCIEQRSEISDGSGGGYAKSSVWSKKYKTLDAGMYGCYDSRFRPPYNIANQNVLAKKKADGNWYVCVWGNTTYSKKTDWARSKQSYYNVPCGRGMYSNFAGGWTTLYRDGHWRPYRFRLFSGGHYLPA